MGLDMILMNSQKEVIHRWRNFHALHKWFVKNVQNGIDNCESHLVSNEKLEELSLLLKQLNTTNAVELFPSVHKQDDYYWKCVNDTIVLLHDIENVNDSFYYCSWW